MEFLEALKILNIEDYSERIFKSNSHGELFHLEQYCVIADAIKDSPDWFRSWFEYVVDCAESGWDRPESVFQHIDKILVEHCNGQVYE